MTRRPFLPVLKEALMLRRSFHSGGPVSLSLLLLVALLPACAGRTPPSSSVLRVGHFPNITHAQGLVAHALTRRGEGWFESRLDGVRIEWFVYNAGPTAMEALLNGSLDLTYVGPNPAINAHVRSAGDEVRVVAGAAEGGAALVVRPDLGIRAPEDFRGRRIGTPQLGNTQDVACRAWLGRHGIHVTTTGGDAGVIPTANPDQLLLFGKGDLDACWTVEPWVSRLEMEAGGTIFLEQPDALTTILVASRRRLDADRDLVRRFVEAHRELTAWILEHPEEAKALVVQELQAETHSAMGRDLVDRSWARLTFTADIAPEPFRQFAVDAAAAGFMPADADLSRLVEHP